MKSRTAWGQLFPSKRLVFNPNALCRLLSPRRSSASIVATTILEHHELDGLLNGIASARAAANPAWVADAVMTLRNSASRGPSPNAWSTGVRSTTSTQDRGCTPPSGPRQNLIPRVLLDDIPNSRDDVLPFTRKRTPQSIGANLKLRGLPASAVLS